MVIGRGSSWPALETRRAHASGDDRADPVRLAGAGGRHPRGRHDWRASTGTSCTSLSGARAGSPAITRRSCSSGCSRRTRPCSRASPRCSAPLGVVSEVVQKLVDKREIPHPGFAPRGGRRGRPRPRRGPGPGGGARALAAHAPLSSGSSAGASGRTCWSRDARRSSPRISGDAVPDERAFPEPTANLPQRRTDFRETPYPLSVPFARDPQPAGRGRAFVERRTAVQPSRAGVHPPRAVGRRALARGVEGERCEVVLDGRSDHVWLQRYDARA